MKKIEHPEDVILCEFDGIESTTVYIGGFMYLERVNDKLKWRLGEESTAMYLEQYKTLSLKEIAEQLDARIITIFEEGALNGTIYQYGNYGDEWWEIGEFAGYA